MHDALTNGGLAADLTQQVRAAREMIAKLETDPSWRDRPAWWVGALQTRLALLCDQIDYTFGGAR